MKLLQINAVPGADAAQSGGIYGGERSVIFLCRGLSERGHQVWLCCAEEAPLVELAKNSGVEIAPIKQGNPRTLPVVWNIVRAARRLKPDLLASHGSRASRLAIMAGRLTGIPVVSTMRGLYRAKSYQNAARIIAVSEGVRQHILSQGVAPEHVVTVHNGADLTRFVPQDGAQAKTQIGMDTDTLIIGVIARLSQEKGHDWFFQSAAPVAREFPKARFLLVGDGPLRGELEAKAKALGIGEQTHFAGYQSDIVPWMAAMDAIVLPSVSHEGFARVLIEAGALQKPAIASPIGGNGEAIIDGETGFLVPVSDVAALSDAMRKLLSQPEARNRMAQAARARVEANFSVPRMVENTERVYQDVLTKRGKG